MSAKLTTPKHLIAVDMVPDKLDLARKYGATHTINPASEDVAIRIQEITGNLGVNYALDAVGSPAILKLAQQSLAVRGMMVTIGGTPNDVSLSTLPHIQKGLTYRGCHMGDSVPSLVSVPIKDSE
jgi:aryl-alcohol dehydrogenase